MPVARAAYHHSCGFIATWARGRGWRGVGRRRSRRCRARRGSGRAASGPPRTRALASTSARQAPSATTCRGDGVAGGGTAGGGVDEMVGGTGGRAPPPSQAAGGGDRAVRQDEAGQLVPGPQGVGQSSRPAAGVGSVAGGAEVTPQVGGPPPAPASTTASATRSAARPLPMPPGSKLTPAGSVTVLRSGSTSIAAGPGVGPVSPAAWVATVAPATSAKSRS